MNLKVLNFGLALGILTGVCILLLTWATMMVKVDAYIIVTNVYAKLMPGYSVTFVGSIIGLVYGFIKGAIFGIVLAWLYNLLNGSTSK